MVANSIGYVLWEWEENDAMWFPSSWWGTWFFFVGPFMGLSTIAEKSSQQRHMLLTAPGAIYLFLLGAVLDLTPFPSLCLMRLKLKLFLKSHWDGTQCVKSTGATGFPMIQFRTFCFSHQGNCRMTQFNNCRTKHNPLYILPVFSAPGKCWHPTPFQLAYYDFKW